MRNSGCQVLNRLFVDPREAMHVKLVALMVNVRDAHGFAQIYLPELGRRRQALTENFDG